MVNFKDFEHDRDEKDRKYWDDGESQALVNMNEWIGSNNIEVVAVETMVTVRGVWPVRLACLMHLDFGIKKNK